MLIAPNYRRLLKADFVFLYDLSRTRHGWTKLNLLDRRINRLRLMDLIERRDNPLTGEPGFVITERGRLSAATYARQNKRITPR